MEKENNIFITKEKLYFEVSLYEKIKIKDLEEGIFSGEVDGYSFQNSIETTYEIKDGHFDAIKNEGGFVTEWNYNSRDLITFGIYEITLTCKRKGEELSLFFLINNDEGYIEKVGQYPSIADITLGKNGKKYSAILEKELLADYNKSIGLFAHGAGAGSFVYLRRIFEKLIFSEFNDNSSSFSISDEDFKVKHMDQKINVLKDYLPSFLVEHKKIYSILSKGIHQLSEDECKQYFPFIKESIDIILEQKIEQKEKVNREKRVKKSLQEVLGEIN